jgi:hypothetical protein
LAKQEKVTRQSRESDHLHSAQCLSVIAPYTSLFKCSLLNSKIQSSSS